MKTIDLGKLGKLRLERVLVKVDYPLLFLCQNERGKLFLFVEKESDATHEEWVVVKTDEEIINKMYRHEVSIQRAFINTEVNRYYIVTHCYENDNYFFTTSKTMPPDVLSNGEDYIPVFDNTDLILSSAKIDDIKNKIFKIDNNGNITDIEIDNNKELSPLEDCDLLLSNDSDEETENKKIINIIKNHYKSIGGTRGNPHHGENEYVIVLKNLKEDEVDFLMEVLKEVLL